MYSSPSFIFLWKGLTVIISSVRYSDYSVKFQSMYIIIQLLCWAIGCCENEVHIWKNYQHLLLLISNYYFSNIQNRKRKWSDFLKVIFTGTWKIFIAFCSLPGTTFELKLRLLN